MLPLFDGTPLYPHPGTTSLCRPPPSILRNYSNDNLPNMPRHKQPFINRSRARTFRLVQSSSVDDDDMSTPQLVRSHSSNDADVTTADSASAKAEYIDVSQWDTEYSRGDYELGEFGFPNDGYDYSKHFKPIGGGGGVFMDAMTGLQKPEAVEGSVAFHSEQKKEEREGEEEKEGEEKGWRRKEDVMKEREVAEQIQRDRKWNKDLNEVLAALDSEGEIGGELEDEDGEWLLGDGKMEEEGCRNLLEDDFVVLAEGEREERHRKEGRREHLAEMVNENKKQNVLEGVIEQYREPRLLDEQFEKFMRAQEWEGSGGGNDGDDDDDDDGIGNFPRETSEGADMLEDFRAHMTCEELNNIWEGNGGLLDDLAKLQIGTEEQGRRDEGDGCEIEGTDDEADGMFNLANSDGAASLSNVKETDQRVAEYEKFANAEFERGVQDLLDSYNRFTGEEALDALDGVGEARKAIERGEREEAAKRERQMELGLDEDSDGHDSELDSHFDELFEDKGDKWDCETILSTYSNLENHPSVIDAPMGRKKPSVPSQPIIRLDPRTQAPTEYMPSVEKSLPQAATVDFGSRRRVVQETQARRRKEPKEEKKARKSAVKEAARERRALKSEMKKAFGSEHVKQSRHATTMGTSKVAIQF